MGILLLFDRIFYSSPLILLIYAIVQIFYVLADFLFISSISCREVDIGNCSCKIPTVLNDSQGKGCLQYS